MAASMELVHQRAKERFGIACLTENQKLAIESAAINQQDVFVGTKTGSGKSLTYEILPCICEAKMIVAIICPLVSIMDEQCCKLNSQGFKATYIGKNADDHDLLEQGHFDFVFGSPELLVGDKRWREMRKNEVYQASLKTIVMDEAHTILQWGEKTTGDEPFRKWFSKIGELRSLCPQANIVALTATAGPTQRRSIMKQLSFRVGNCVTILDSPDRKNIKITSKILPNQSDASENFGWLIDLLQKHNQGSSRFVIFCRTIAECSKVYFAFDQVLGRQTGLFDMYHSKTKDAIKQDIRSRMTQDSDLCVLICTNAAGMGVNFHNVNNVIHYGLPFELDTFVQQMGRAGRDGTPAHELVLYKAHKGQLKKVESELLKVVKETSCRHKMICQSYCSKHEVITPKHRCCDICAQTCDCDLQECPDDHVMVNYAYDSQGDVLSDISQREVKDNQRELLRHKLNSYMFKLFSTCTIVNPDIVFGINEDVISAILDKSGHLLSIDDVIKELPIWSYNCAREIGKILNEVFDDMDISSGQSTSDSDDSD